MTDIYDDSLLHFSAGAADTGTRLDVFLAERSGVSRSRIQRAIRGGHVEVNRSVMLKPSCRVEEGDSISCSLVSDVEPDFIPESIPLNIVFEDPHIIVVNKPAGMVVHPGRGNVTGTLVSALLYHCSAIRNVGEPIRPGVVHRLDRDTSGLIVAALTPESHAVLSRMIYNRVVKKEYTAFVWGHPEPPEGTVDAPLGRHPRSGTLRAVREDGKPAVTHYEVTASYRFLSRMTVRLETGRTHQIRVHCAYMGHPVFGDPLYGGREKMLKGFDPGVREQARFLLKQLNRQALHASRLEFMHPSTGEPLVFEAPLPVDLQRLVEALENE